MSATAAHALLKQLQASFQVRLGEVRYFDYEAEDYLWMLSANDNEGRQWTAKHLLAELLGFELETGDGAQGSYMSTQSTDHDCKNQPVPPPNHSAAGLSTHQ